MFIPKILKITDWKTRLLQDRTALLRDIIKSFVLRIPFQNVTSFGAVKMYERKKPGMKEFFEACFRNSGGLCPHSNYTLKLVLESIGYETQILSGMFRRTGIPGSHLCFTVRIPYSRPSSSLLGTQRPPEKLYFVDVGCGVPIHEPILIGELPYHGRAGGLDFRYEMLDVRNIKRVNVNGDALVGPKPSGFESPQDYTMDLTTKSGPDLFVINGSLDEIVRSYDKIFLHQGFYLFRYLDISENDFKVVWIRGKDLIFATKETRTVQTFDDIRQLQPYIHEYFPMIDQREVELSMQNFAIFKSERERVLARKSA